MLDQPHLTEPLTEAFQWRAKFQRMEVESANRGDWDRSSMYAQLAVAAEYEAIKLGATRKQLEAVQ